MGEKSWQWDANRKNLVPRKCHNLHNKKKKTHGKRKNRLSGKTFHRGGVRPAHTNCPQAGPKIEKTIPTNAGELKNCQKQDQ